MYDKVNEECQNGCVIRTLLSGFFYLSFRIAVDSTVLKVKCKQLSLVEGNVDAGNMEGCHDQAMMRRVRKGNRAAGQGMHARYWTAVILSWKAFIRLHL